MLPDVISPRMVRGADSEVSFAAATAGGKNRADAPTAAAEPPPYPPLPFAALSPLMGTFVPSPAVTVSNETSSFPPRPSSARPSPRSHGP
jgi:hypothetical protein